MESSAKKPDARESHYTRLMAFATGQGNDDALACMYASWKEGRSALPVFWGLAHDDFEQLMALHFPGCAIELPSNAESDGMDSDRTDEQLELVDLMRRHRAGVSLSEQSIASIVACACLGNDHLWQDLGLWCREDLSDLMARNFPALASRNVHNMKWKKFLYKQLCIAEGIYVCRAPSCEVCTDYDHCFGSGGE